MKKDRQSRSFGKHGEKGRESRLAWGLGFELALPKDSKGSEAENNQRVAGAKGRGELRLGSNS